MFEGAGDEDLEDGRHRHREQHAQEPEDLTTDEQREQHPHFLEPDALAHDAGRDHEALQALHHGVGGHDTEQLAPASPADQAHDHACDQRERTADVRHEISTPAAIPIGTASRTPKSQYEPP